MLMWNSADVLTCVSSTSYPYTHTTQHIRGQFGLLPLFNTISEVLNNLEKSCLSAAFNVSQRVQCAGAATRWQHDALLPLRETDPRVG